MSAALLLSGCGTSGGGASPTAGKTAARSSTSTTAAPASPSPSPSGPTCKNQKPFTGEAADYFGEANVLSAYCLALRYVAEESVSDLAEQRRTYRPEQFAFVKPYLTKTAQAAWDRFVAKAIKGDDKASRTVDFLAVFDFSSAYYTFDKSAPSKTRNVRVSGAKAELTSGRAGKRLKLRFKVVYDLAMIQTEDRKPVTVSLTRPQTFWLVLNDSETHPWLIDGWGLTGNVGWKCPGATSKEELRRCGTLASGTRLKGDKP